MKLTHLITMSRLGGICILLFFYSTTCLAQEDTSFVVPETDPVISGDSLVSANRFLDIDDTLAFLERKLTPGQKQTYRDDEEFWYGNADLKKTKRQILEERRTGKKGSQENGTAIKEKQVRTPLTMKPWFQTLLWIIIVIGFTVFLIIYLGNSNVGIFRKKVRRTAGIDDDEKIPEDIFAINYSREIEKAITEGNFRLAVRLHYLSLLKKLADSKIIRYTQDKTNFDYLVELQPTRYYEPFFRVTRNYEYSWYGKFAVSEDAYNRIKKDFYHLDQQLNRH